MNDKTPAKNAARQSKDRFWIVEVLALAAVVPALFAGVAAISKLPLI